MKKRALGPEPLALHKQHKIDGFVAWCAPFLHKFSPQLSYLVELTMAAALIVPFSRSAGTAHTLTKFGKRLDHADAMPTDSLIVNVPQFLAKI